MKLPKRKVRSCAIPFVNRKMKAKEKESLMLQFNLNIVLVNVLPPSPHVVVRPFMNSAYCRRMVLTEHGSYRR